MIRAPILCALLAGWTSSSAISAQAVLIFEDGFESGETCAWNADQGGDLCSGISPLFAHTGQNLYRIDASNFGATLVGGFDTGGASITDIAIDRNDVMVGVSSSKLWSIDPTTGAASQIAAFDGASDGLTSLSFVPVDDSDPGSAERLIAAGNSGNVYEVDRATGVATLRGNFGLSGGKQIRSGGDIVSIRGVGTFATVSIGDDPSETDFLASIDPTTWVATPIGELSTGYDKVFGLGYWDGTIVGFVDDGSVAQSGTIISIDPATGVGTSLKTLPTRWFGAGVATDVPLAK